MNKNKLIYFLILCFSLTWICFGILVANSHFEIVSNNNFVSNVAKSVGAFMPTIAIVILLKKYGSVYGRKTIWQFICDFPKKISAYGIILLFMAWRLLVFVINGDLSQANSLYMLIPVVLIQLFFQGGFEEPGWRGFLQPCFEKKYPFIISVVFVSIVWAIWHIPLWFVANSVQGQMNFLIFFLQILVNSFTLAAILKITKSVFFCMLYHAWGNAVFLIIPFEMSNGMIVAYTLEAIIALTLSLIYIKKYENAV